MKVNIHTSNLNKKKNPLHKTLKPMKLKNRKLRVKQSKEISEGLRENVESEKINLQPKPTSTARPRIKTNSIEKFLRENNLISTIKVTKRKNPNGIKSKLEQNKSTPISVIPKISQNHLQKQILVKGKSTSTHKIKNNVPNKSTNSKTSKNRPMSAKVLREKNTSHIKAKDIKTNSKQVAKGAKKKLKKVDSKNPCLLKLDKVSSSVSGLLKLLKEKSQNKSELLDLEEPIFLQVECIKIPICPTKQLRFVLPHPLVNELSDVLLITADKKGSKIHPDKAVEHYTDLLDKHKVNFIQKVMPLRMLRQEYSQYEMKRKLVDQFDVILADANVLPSLPKILGGFALFSRKMPIPVHLNRQDLKQHLQTAISKTQMTIKSKGNISIVQVGHTKMADSEVAANILEVSHGLEKLYPGGWPNMRSLHIKTATSPTIAIYVSLVSPNSVEVPVIKVKKPLPVEGELSTYPDRIVVVKPDGSIHLKKEKNDTPVELDMQFDDEIIQAAQKYLQATKTVRYDSEEEDNDAVEEDFLKNYEAAKKANAVNSDEEKEEEEEEEEEEESDDEEPVLPPAVLSKKRKTEPAKKQAAGKSPNKKQKLNTNSQQKKPNPNKPGSIGKPQKRGARGGKKNKMSKDQRKALIKRKKAGKK